MDGEMITREQLGSIVSRDPRVHSGDLVFAGTRVPVATLIDYLKGGHSIEDFLEGFPSVESWQVEAFLGSGSLPVAKVPEPKSEHQPLPSRSAGT